MSKTVEGVDLQGQQIANDFAIECEAPFLGPNYASFMPEVTSESDHTKVVYEAAGLPGFEFDKSKQQHNFFANLGAEGKSKIHEGIMVAAGVVVSINLNAHPEHETIILAPNATASFRKQLSDGSWEIAKYSAGTNFVEVKLNGLEFTAFSEHS